MKYRKYRIVTKYCGDTPYYVIEVYRIFSNPHYGDWNYVTEYNTYDDAIKALAKVRN